MARPAIDRLVLFGATGDLAGRYLLPALAALHAADLLPDDFAITAASIEDSDDEQFRRHAAERLEEHAADEPATAREAIVGMLHYRRIDFDDPATVRHAIEGDAPVVAYLALPPAVMPSAVDALGAAGLPSGSRIAIEKPFGEDLASARALNAQLRRCTGGDGEEGVFRVDHFLGLAPVQNLLGLRLANRVLEPVWNSAHVERVDIVWDETLTLEGRASFYDDTGALRDLIQNHLLQVLSLIAMEPPARLRDDLADRKVDVLRAVRPVTAQDTRRARYTAGRIGDRDVPDYADEEGVEAGRCTETLAEVTLHLDSERWSGTPFFLRAAKAVARDRMETVVRFRPVERAPFAADAGAPEPNELRIGLAEPGSVSLHLTGNTAGPPLHLTPLALTADLAEPRLPEYGRVLLDVLGGDSALGVRGDGAEEAWRIVDPILEAWGDGAVPLEEYRAGSDGPDR